MSRKIQWTKEDKNRAQTTRVASVERNGLSLLFSIEESGQTFTLTLKELTYLLDLAEKHLPFLASLFKGKVK
jgi:hypothetical protein